MVTRLVVACWRIVDASVSQGLGACLQGALDGGRTALVAADVDDDTLGQDESNLLMNMGFLFYIAVIAKTVTNVTNSVVMPQPTFTMLVEPQACCAAFDTQEYAE